MGWSDMMLGGILGYSLRSLAGEQQKEEIVKFARKLGTQMAFQAIIDAAKNCDSLEKTEGCSKKCIYLTLAHICGEIDLSHMDRNDENDCNFLKNVRSFRRTLQTMANDCE